MNLEKQIEEFLNLLSEANILFRGGVGLYLEENAHGERFQSRLQQLQLHERELDILSRFIEAHLRAQPIVPELRGDVLQLLEQLSRLQRLLAKNLEEFEAECPNIPTEMHGRFNELCHFVSMAVGTCVEAGHIFFHETEKVGEYLSKVAFYEKEADKRVLGLVKSTFSHPNLSLAEKIHIRRFVDKVDEPANKAEEIAAWLAIFFLKRAPLYPVISQ
ncbi:MAG: DUF47 family protein [Magnetococcales bacterium]|nr:DUF47 family protein [Magnetococcales bacterium]NGZ05304.1 DUF47 family protein [Magnetococcales bacterium]